MLSYVAVIVIFVVALVYLITRGSERHVLAFAIALLFVGIAVPLSLHDIHLHALHYVRPDIQRYYVRILWMVRVRRMAAADYGHGSIQFSVGTRGAGTLTGHQKQ